MFENDFKCFGVIVVHFFSVSVILKQSPGGLVKLQVAGPLPRFSDLAGLGQELSPGSTLWEPQFLSIGIYLQV